MKSALVSGLEALQANVTPRKVVVPSLFALDMMEQAAMLSDSCNNLMAIDSFVEELEHIAAFAREKKPSVDQMAYLQHTQGAALAQALGQEVDFSKPEELAIAVEASMKGYYEAIVKQVQATIERIRVFLGKLLTSEKGVAKALKKQTERIDKIKEPKWKKAKKVFEIPGAVDEKSGDGALKMADAVLKGAQQDLSKFNPADVSDAFLSGSVLTVLRTEASKVKEVNCEKTTLSAGTIVDMVKSAEDALKKVAGTKASYRLAKSLKPVARNMTTPDQSKVKPTKAFAAAAAVYNWYGVYYLRIAVAMIRVLRNVA